MNKQLSKEWFEQRKGRITGSIAGAALGLSPFMNQADVIRTMVRAAHGAESEFKGNIATEYGNRNEAEAIKCFEMETGLTVEETGFYTHSDWLGASPDGMIKGENSVIEVKCPFGLRNDTDPKFKTAQEQPHYYAQMQIEMFCTDSERCYFYQWSPYGSQMELVTRNNIYLDKILGDLIMFYRDFSFENRVNYAIHLRDKNASTVELGDEEINAVVAYKEAKQAFDDAKSAFDDAKTALIDIAESTGDSKVILDDVKLLKVKRAGTIAYAKMVKDLLPGVPTDKYKGADSEYWKIG